MTDNKKIILEEFESLKGQLVIAGDWKVKRLIAVVEDAMDYYWLFYDENLRNSNIIKFD